MFYQSQEVSLEKIYLNTLFNRTSITVFVFLFCLTINLQAQENDWGKVLKGRTDTLQNTYFLGRLNAQFETRREEVDKAAESEVKMIARRDYMREWYISKVGELPLKSPLDPVLSEKTDLGAYTVQKVVFESKPNHHITGLFYLPKNIKNPCPGVYIPCGHTKMAKSYPDYQKAARLFAMNGFVVLQADPICQGERFQYLDKDGNPVTREGTYMHEQLGHALLLTGKNTLIEELEDNIRCLDFLEQQPEVDKERLAVAGHSGGGTQTTYLAAFDRRIKAATPVCYIATSEDKLNTIGSQDGCQQLWGEGKAGIEEQDFLFMASPAPIRILATEEDFFSISGARVAYDDLKKMYSTIGIPEKVDMVICPGGHGWHRPLREASVLWCKRWLMNDLSPVVEPMDIGYFEDRDQVAASPTGQVMTSFPGEKSVTDLTRERVVKCAENRKGYLMAHSSSEIIKKIKQLTGFEEPGQNCLFENVDSANKDSFKVVKLLIRREENRGFLLPGLLYVPDMGDDKTPATIIISQEGKEDPASWPIIDEEIKKGRMVLAVDISNTGELMDKRKIDSNNREFWIAKLPLFEGKTLLAYRAEDILLSAKYIKKTGKAEPRDINLISIGYTGPAALHAAVFWQCFNNVKIIGAIASWEDVANAYHSKDQLGNVVPGALNYYDLPNLMRLATETHIEIISPVDAEGRVKKK